MGPASLLYPIIAHCWSRPDYRYQQSVFDALGAMSATSLLDYYRPDTLAMRDVAALSVRAANSSVVLLRRIRNGLDTIASLTLSLPALSRLREPPSIVLSSLWALDHDPSNIVLVTEAPALSAPPSRCACRFCLDGSRGTTLAWSKVATWIYVAP